MLDMDCDGKVSRQELVEAFSSVNISIQWSK